MYALVLVILMASGTYNGPPDVPMFSSKESCDTFAQAIGAMAAKDKSIKKMILKCKPVTFMEQQPA